MRGLSPPLLPFLLLDAGWLDIHRIVERLDCRNEMKRHKRAMQQAYGKCMGWLFRALDEPQTDYVVDLMDDLEAAIDHDRNIAGFTAMRALAKDFNHQQQVVTTAAIMCNTMAWMAAEIADKLYVNDAMAALKADINTLRYHCREFAAALMRRDHIPNSGISEEQAKEIDTAALILEKRIVSWTNEKLSDESNK